MSDLADDDHRLRQEVRDMDFVREEGYVNFSGKYPELFVNFEEGIESMPREFKMWLSENDLVILAANINTVDEGTTLAVEVQTRDRAWEGKIP